MSGTMSHDMFSAAMAGDDMAKFDTMGADVPDIFSDEEVGEVEELLGKAASPETAPKAAAEAPTTEAPPATAKSDDEPPAWFKAWLSTQSPASATAPAASSEKAEEPKTSTPEEMLAALVSDPTKAISEEVRRTAEQLLAPMRQEYRAAIHHASMASAVAMHGKEMVAAAENALKSAVESGRMDRAKVAAALQGSTDPVGDMVRWHQQDQQRARIDAMSRDPDGFLLQQLTEAVKDPAKREKFMAAIGQAAPTPAATQTEGGTVTEFQRRDDKSGRFLPSLNRASSAADDDGEPSDPGGMFKAAMRGPRR